MITLHTSTSRCDVDERCGARLASLRFAEREVLVTGGVSDDPLGWGCYPMVPWAGRLRDGQVDVGGTRHVVQGVGRSGAHPLHGTVADLPWQVEAVDDTTVRCVTSLGDRWPTGGTVVHEISLGAAHVTCVLTLTAHDVAFPAQVGWHPWFTPDWRRHVGFRARYRRDHTVLPTGEVVAVTDTTLGPEPLDDCFVSPRWPPRLVHGDGTTLELHSDAGHWVVYDAPGGAVCVEPQSGPPDAAHLEPVVVPAGGSVRRFLHLAVTLP